jgi:FMN-dependent NADH-azoreductase
LADPPEGSLDVSEALIQEVEAADATVIGTPMYNYSIPSVFKAWIDQILRVGRTMKSTPTGKVGLLLLRDRPVYIAVSSGGVFSGDRANQPDFVAPYLTLAFNSIGLKTLQFLPIQATAFLDGDKAELAREKALAALDLMAVQDIDACPAPLAGGG